jgi:2-polyprenyl-3-methyl-5-hydroxy-6-metoxy-1,4-benzoquinol methylase
MNVREAFQHYGPTVVRLVPTPLREPLARAHRPLARYVAAGKYRRKYGAGFVSRFHPEDDLMHYTFDFARQEPALRYYHGVRMYFEGGEWNAAEVDKVLRDVGFSLRDAGSMLEFACGYGRLTRHLVHMISPSRITGSDIDPRAVEFVTEQFGIRGFPSTASPEDLHHDRRYELIVVVSLFSHLPSDTWGPWLTRLHGLLEDDGLLLFSTLGTHAYEVNIPDSDRPAFQTITEGFFYNTSNETRGRLSGDQYGVAYVSEDYVRGAVKRSFDGRMLTFVPRALNGFQDVYVLQRAAANAAS